MNACNAGDVLSELKRYVEDCVAERNTGRDDDLYEMPKDQQHPDAVVATGTIPWSLRHMSQIGDRSMWISFYRFDDVIQGNLSIGSGDRRQASAAVHWDAENDGRALKLRAGRVSQCGGLCQALLGAVPVSGVVVGRLTSNYVSYRYFAIASSRGGSPRAPWPYFRQSNFTTWLRKAL